MRFSEERGGMYNENRHPREGEAVMTEEQINLKCAQLMGWSHCTATNANPVIRHGMKLPNFFIKEQEAWWNDSIEGVFAEPPRFTTSMDAAMGLVEALGDWQWSGTRHRKSGTFSCSFEKDEDTHHSAINQKSMPIAICLAFLAVHGISHWRRSRERA